MTGVRQGRLLSPFLFILAIDWIMKTENKGQINGIQWNILKQLDDLDFADDLALMYHSHRQMQYKTTYLARISAQLGLTINKKKTKILRLNTTCERPIMLEGEGLEEVESFRYLGSIVDTRGGTEADVKTRISKARAAFHILRNVWKPRIIAQKNPSVQHKCQVCVSIRSRNVANEQDHTEKGPDFCKSVLAENIWNTVDGQSRQQGPLG